MIRADVAAIVLAAGVGKRLQPLTAVRPKPLCPVNNVPLIEYAFDEVASVLGPVGRDRLAVNAHHLAEQVIAQVGERVHISHEQPTALGTAGAVGQLRPWLAGRPALIRNADAYRDPVVGPDFVDDWDGERPRLLVVADELRPDFDGRWRYAGLSLLPWPDAAALPPEPNGLNEAVWQQAARDGRVELVQSAADFIDCGTPADYLRANLAASGGRSVVGVGALVEGELVRSVVWPDGVVRRGERLVEAIRVGADLTVPGS